MKRIKLEIAYDGTNYCGWQLQPGMPTVEAMINKALSELLKEEIAVIGASRTDSGVHALGNVAVFDTNTRIPAEKICMALNQRLPEDIKVQSSVEVAPDFHPRKVNSRKTYEYRILNRPIALPTKRLYSTFVYYSLDIRAMQKAASYLVGTHDFKSFCSVKTQVKETVRIIYDLTVSKESDVITISVTGNGFLYNMVRIIAGTLIEVGRGAIPPLSMTDILKGCERSLAGPTAPPEGLTLINIDYLTDQI
ncbi:MAG: tRNA pseudouridine(38-40) synthase TruA [Clostridiales bacterium]|nr:tRNA pseudouridine(38-40) synthase TruA [Clostridiales bacterium]